jgi:hypothetical protein
MSNLDEKSAAATTNVLTITRTTPTRLASNQSIDVLTTIEDVDSTHSLTPTQTSSPREKSLDRETSPFSPFYNPNPTRYSLEAQKSESKQNINVIQPSTYDNDVEACLTLQQTKSGMGLLKARSGNVESQVWPGRKAMKMKKKAMRREKGKYMMCGCMAGLDKRTKIWVKILTALVVVGLAVGVGVGVSRAVGGGVWKNSTNANSPISGS